MKKDNLNGNTMMIVLIVVVIALLGVGYAVMHKSKKTTPTTTASTSTPSTTSNAVLVTKTTAGVGQYLANPSGSALYTFGADTSGVSNCTGTCIANWPAYQDTGSTTNLPTGVSTIKRSDNGQTQYTYMGMPLYTFIKDGSGNVTGNGVENFSVAKPSAASTTPTSNSPTPTPSSSSSGNGY